VNTQQLYEAVIAKFIRGAPLALYDIGVGPKSEWRALRKRYRKLKVYGCEPHPATYQTLLRDGFPGPLLNVAIGEADDTATLFDIADDAKRASLLPLGDSERQIPTDVWTLDRFDREMGRQDRILLWMDIEGTELAALRGGTELLDSGRVRWINLEERRNGDCPAAGWTDPAELHSFLTSHGFVRAADYNRHPTHQDAIYVHREEQR
jgi:FkbM family methyltransferase